MEALGSASKAAFRNASSSNRTYYTNFFREAPYAECLSLQEFESFALERLKVLRVFENVAFRVSKYTHEYMDLVNKELGKDFREKYVKPIKFNADYGVLEENKRQDILSHFALRLVFCRNEDHKRWFLTQETDLFFYRLSGEHCEAIAGFLRDSGLNYSPLPVEEYNNLRTILAKSTFFKHEGADLNYPEAEFYKMDFLEALDQVKKRRVYLSQGWAYVPRKLLLEVVAARFREHLSLELSKLGRIMAESQEDTRLIPLLNKLASGYTGKDFSISDTDYGINLNTLDQVAAESFPLCARNMHDHLRKDHYLKHDARLQYGLFIKGIGISMDDNMKLMRTEFSRKGVSESKFAKEHAYNYRHMYGKEGKRTNYTPSSCLKIITGKAPSNADEHHGCPFKHFARPLLIQRMKHYGVSEEDSQAIVAHVSRGHYQVACTKYFEAVHKDKVKLPPFIEPIQHPNQFVEESRRYLHPDLVKEKPVVFHARNPNPAGPLPVQTVYKQPNTQQDDWGAPLSQEDVEALSAMDFEHDQPTS